MGQTSDTRVEGLFNEGSYKKVVRILDAKDSLSQEELRLKAQAHEEIGELDKAGESRYACIQQGPEPADLLAYARLLERQGKNDQAALWLRTYSALNPTDEKVAKEVEQPGYMDQLNEPNERVSVSSLDFNSKEQDFGGTWFDGRVIFSSSRSSGRPVRRVQPDNNLGFADLFVAEVDSSGEWVGVTPLDPSLNTQYHDGPATFNAETRDLVYSVNSDPDSTGRLKLVLQQSRLEENGWRPPETLFIGNQRYGVAHPTLSPNGKRMLFSSDKPGGRGGSDLFEVYMEPDGSWSEPVNLGQAINSPGNEMFPFYLSDQIVYFASDGFLGLGGLDIFRAELDKNGRVISVVNLGAPFNSADDDFALLTTDEESSGYITSNREGGAGSDDIYHFDFASGENVKKQVQEDELNGLIVYQKSPEANVQMNLFDESGRKVGEAVSDSTGQFVFKGLQYFEEYEIRVAERNEGLMSDLSIYFLDEEGMRVDSAHAVSKGAFVFQHLPREEMDRPSVEAKDVETVEMDGIFQYEGLPKSNVDLVIIDEGDVAGTVKTNVDGSFTFSNLKPQHVYLVRLNTPDTKLDIEKARILFLDDQRRVVSQAERLDEEFRFESRSLLDGALTLKHFARTQVKGRLIKTGTPLGGVPLFLLDADSHKIAVATTDGQGMFEFHELAYMTDYTIQVDERFLELGEGVEIEFIDDLEKDLDTSLVGRLNKFGFTLLPPIQASRPSISEFDYSTLGQYRGLLHQNGKPIGNSKVFLLDVMQHPLDSVTTNAAGQFSFPRVISHEDYFLSPMDDPTAADALSIVMFDTAGLSHRFSEPKEGMELFWSKRKLRGNTFVPMDGKLLVAEEGAADAQIYLVHLNGSLLDSTRTTRDGSFNFERVKVWTPYVLKTDLDEKDLRVEIAETRFHKAGEAASFGQGQFIFELLPQITPQSLPFEDEEDLATTVNIDGQFDFSKLEAERVNLVLFDEQLRPIDTLVARNGKKFTARKLEPRSLYYLQSEGEETEGLTRNSIELLNRSGRPYEYARDVSVNAEAFISPGNPTSGELDSTDEARLARAMDPALRPLFVTFGSSTIDQKEFGKLDRVVGYLEQNPSIRLEVQSYTDSKGASGYNQRLSQKRAEAAVDYLVQQGIDRSRLTAIGKGESGILNGCIDGVSCTDEQHNENRRTEFVIVN